MGNHMKEVEDRQPLDLGPKGPCVADDDNAIAAVRPSLSSSATDFLKGGPPPWLVIIGDNMNRLA